MRVLLIEDDTHIGRSLSAAFKSEGYVCDWLTNFEEGEVALRLGAFDLIVLDWMLPDGSGPDFLSAQRRRGLHTPVLMLTARTQAADKIAGLDSGADDYLSKPFDLGELLARMRALGRRKTVEPTRILSVGSINIDPDARKVTIHDEPVALSSGEFEILRVLAEKAGRYLSKEQLERAAYSWDSEVTPNAIEAQVSRLRKKIGSERLSTLRGVGYCLEG